MRGVLGIDVETRSAVSVKDTGAPAYAAHPTTRILCAVLILDDRVARWTPGPPVPPWAVAHVRAGRPVCAHNAGFESAVLPRCMPGLPEVAADQWVDTAALAALMNLPSSLEGLGAALGLTVKKDMEGNALMRRLSNANNPEPTGAELARLTDYCETDVRVMLDVLARLPAPPLVELAAMAEDRRINARGVCVDVGLADGLQRVADAREGQLVFELFDITGDLHRLHVAADLLEWVQSRGVTVPKTRTKDGWKLSFNREVVTRLMNDPESPPDVRAALACRQEGGRLTSLAKLARVEPMLVDGRLRGSLRYCAAHTGRWGSSGLQLHNLPKVKKEFGKVLPAVRQAARDGAVDKIATAWPNVLEACSQLLRSMIVAAPGHEFIGCDFSAIEARVLAWVACQHDVLDVFQSGRDIYVEDAAKIGSQDRQLGKVQRLALGYGMGVVKFVEAAATYGIALTLKRAREVQQGWREANPAIVGFWRDLEDGFRTAMAGTTVSLGTVKIIGSKQCVRIVLPSGRALHYWRPHTAVVRREFEVVDADGNVTKKSREVEEIRFFGTDRKTMVCESTYGGKLTENVVQAIARDILSESILRLRNTMYSVVLHVHDSVVSEVPAGAGDVAEFSTLVAQVPAWAPGLPLACEGYRNTYFKG